MLAVELERATGSATARVFADRLADGFAVPYTDGGFARWSDDGVFFATYPSSVPSYQLDGGLIAGYALHEYALHSGRPEVQALVRSAASWFERNIERYDVSADARGGVFNAPASALGRAGSSLTFRLVGPGNATIAGIELAVGDATVTADLSVPPPTSAPPPPIALLVDAAYHNWSPARTLNGRTVRDVRSGQGIDDVAPFVATLPAGPDDAARTLEIETVEVAGQVSVEVLLGVAYRHLVDLPEGGPASTEIELPTLDQELALFVDPATTVTATELTMLLGRAWDLPRLVEVAEEWRRSQAFVPGATDSRALPARELELDREPVIATDPDGGILHTEYPAIVSSWIVLEMLYSRYTTSDGVWRIVGVRSFDNGGTWEDDVVVIDGPSFGARSVAFPDVLSLPAGGVLVAFSADLDPEPGYDSVMIAGGPDVWTLGPPRVAVSAPGVDPTLWLEGGDIHLAYVVAAPNGPTRIDQSVLMDGGWAPASTLFTSTWSSVYTQASFVWQGVRWWALNFSGGRQFVQLYCRGAQGGLIPVPDSEFAVVDTGLAVWNQYRYGFEIVDLGGPDPVAFYNGIRLDQGDGTGAIGRSPLTLDGIEVPDECREGPVDAFP